MKELFTEVSGKEKEELKVIHVTFLVYNSGMKKATTHAIELFTLLNAKVKSQVNYYTCSSLC